MPPAAAVTNTTSSGVGWATSRMPIVVRPVPIIATAASAARSSGSSCSAPTGATRQLGVPAARHAEVRHHPAPPPALVDSRPHGVDPASHLAPGSHGQVGEGKRSARLPLADRRVQQVHARGLDGDAHLVAPGTGSATSS